MPSPPAPWVVDLVLVTIVVLPLSMAALFLFLVARLRSRHLLQAGLIRVVFLPEKRRRFLTLLGLLSVFFLASGAITGLWSIGLLSETWDNILSPIAYLGGAVWLFLLIWTSLHPGVLTADQVARLSAAPREFHSMAMIPLELAPATSPD